MFCNHRRTNIDFQGTIHLIFYLLGFLTIGVLGKAPKDRILSLYQ